MAPWAIEAFPCQNSTLGIVRTPLYRDRQIGADVLTLLATDTVLHPRWYRLQPFVKIEYLGRAHGKT